MAHVKVDPECVARNSLIWLRISPVSIAKACLKCYSNRSENQRVRRLALLLPQEPANLVAIFGFEFGGFFRELAGGFGLRGGLGVDRGQPKAVGGVGGARPDKSAGDV